MFFKHFAHHFYACGADGMPPQLTCRGQEYVLEKVFKHDFWAATGLYRSLQEGRHGNRRVICKMNRWMHFLGLPLWPIGWVLSRREFLNLKRLDGIAQVPQVLERIKPNGCVYRYIEGESLNDASELPLDFFEKFLEVVQIIHARNIVYFDLNKRGNILLGADGLPYLIDFQISAHIPDRLLISKRLSRRFRKWLQSYDIYHLYKHKRNLLPHMLTAAEEKLSYNDSVGLRLHRAMANPYKTVRRRCLRYLCQKGIIKRLPNTEYNIETDPNRWLEKK